MHKDGVHTFTDLIPLKLTKKGGKWVEIGGEHQVVEAPLGMDKFSKHAITVNRAEPEDNDPVRWQTSFEPVTGVRLTIREKFGVLGEYDAVFTVTGKKNEHYVKTLHVKGDDIGEVVFPTDFDTEFDFGWLGEELHWRAEVNGKAVLQGVFSFDRRESSDNMTSTGVTKVRLIRLR